MAEVFVARQPIFDLGRSVIGYELLFRSGPVGRADYTDGDRATSQVIVNTFLDLGIESIVGPDRLTFINATRTFIIGELPLPLRPESVILEVLEDLVADDALVTSLTRMRAAGWRFALDDFVWTPSTDVLLPLADFVKLDVLNTVPETLARVVARCREFPVRLIAEKVETPEHLKLAKELGFDLFQGFLFSRPQLMSASKLTPSQVQLMQLVATLSRADATAHEIETLVRSDASLSYRILRAANSASLGLTRRIGTLREAIMMLGLRQLRNWVLLMSLSAATPVSEHELGELMTRARMCELLVDAAAGDRDAGFVVGLLSGMDRLLGQPLEEILGQMPLREDVQEALLGGTGMLGEALIVVRAYENDTVPDGRRSEWDELTLRRAYLEAVAWSLQLWGAMAD